MNQMLLHIQFAEACGDHSLRVGFGDGTEKVVDVSPLLCGEVFKPLLEPFDALKRDVMEGIEEAERGEVAELDVEAIIAAGRRELARREKVETLRRDLMIGIEEIERGEVSNATANDIIAEGRRILAQRRRET